MTSDLETSYRHCRAVVRRASSNLASTFWLLPAVQRRGMDALYAFARQADDLVDSDEPPEVRREKLAQFRGAVVARLAPDAAEGPPISSELSGPLALLPALEDTVRHFHVPPEHLLELLRGVEMDLDVARYASFEELRLYCYRVASAVGLACLPIWGCREAAAQQPAIDCGIAFQLTNILRDIGEDFRRGRIYLPADELERFGLSESLERPVAAEWEEFLQFQISRAESFFESGAVTSRYLPAAGRRVFHLMLARYQTILKEIKRRGPSVLQERVQLSFPRKLLIAAGALLFPPRMAGGTLRVPSAPQTGSAGSNSVAIIGGGLAGLAAAAALCERGFQVEVFEARRRLGGRAGSYLDQESGELVDHCQHVAMGCCTNFLDFSHRTGILKLFERHRTLHFFGPQGERCDFRPSSWLPAPLHLAPAFQGLSYLSPEERRSIAWTLLKLARLPAKEQPGDPTIGQWLIAQKQSPRCIERFWQVVLVSALGESLDRASLSAARKVFVDGFLAARGASDVLVPKVPLAELYQRVAEWLERRGVRVQLQSPVTDVDLDDRRMVILAVPWRRVGELLSPHIRNRLGESIAVIDQMSSAPITSVHLWLDRPIMALPHAVLVGRLSQWVFARGRRTGDGGQETLVPQESPVSSPLSPSYYQVVISASHDLAGRQRDEVVREVRGDLEAIFPAAREAQLLRWQMITEQEAVFSVRPGLDQVRPRQATSIPNLFLAGDWTATGWPSTMEGGVRSGYLAAEEVLRAAGRVNRILVPDLRRGLLASFLS